MDAQLKGPGDAGRYLGGEKLGANSVTDEGRKAPSKRLSVSMSNLLMLFTITAISIAWWVDRNRTSPQEYDIPGPIFVSYKVRTSSSSTSGGKVSGVKGINYQGNNIIVHTENGGTVMSGNSLIEFTWKQE